MISRWIFFPRAARRDVSLDQEEGFPVCDFHNFLRVLMMPRSRTEQKLRRVSPRTHEFLLH